jgi:hypothetical protein
VHVEIDGSLISGKTKAVLDYNAQKNILKSRTVVSYVRPVSNLDRNGQWFAVLLRAGLPKQGSGSLSSCKLESFDAVTRHLAPPE